MADRRTEEPSPPDKPREPVEWWRALIDDPAVAEPDEGPVSEPGCEGEPRANP